MESAKLLKISAKFFGTSFLILLATSCAQSENSAATHYATAPNGQTPANSTSALSSTVQNAIFGQTGAYTGTLLSLQGGVYVDQQSYTISLTQATVSGDPRSYANMRLISKNGSAFADIDDSSLLDIYLNGAPSNTNGNVESEYVFVTGAHTISQIAPTKVAIRIDLFLTSNNQVDTSRSFVELLDAGYGTVSETPSSYAAFTNFSR